MGLATSTASDWYAAGNREAPEGQSSRRRLEKAHVGRLPSSGLVYLFLRKVNLASRRPPS